LPFSDHATDCERPQYQKGQKEEMMPRRGLFQGGLVPQAAFALVAAASGLLLPACTARADVETVTVQLEDERCAACTARIENNLRRLEGVRSVEASVVAGRVTMTWRPDVPLEIARIREAVLRWRGGVRYGGADVTVVGLVETSKPGGTETEGKGEAGARTGPPSAAMPLLRCPETNQRFCLRAGTTGLAQFTFRAGQPYRVTGRVIKSGEGKHEEIWLELEHAEALEHPG
jgi:copper chaperone CopZ